MLSKLGYDSTFQPKKNSPCLQFGYYSDGVGILWKSDKWKLMGEAKNGSVVGDVKVPHCMVSLVPVEGAEVPRVFVATTHLKSKETAENEETRRTQVEAVCGKVRREKGDDEAVILTGDFNTEPHDIDLYEAKAVEQVTRDLPEVGSAYELEDRNHWTTWKKRGDKEFKRQIDYIFYEKDRLGALEVMGAPEEADMKPHRLPCDRYPSDHLSIAVKLRWKGMS